MPQHHVIPKHEWMMRFGTLMGVNSPENLVNLTHEQHIQVHKRYYEDRGLLGDKLAWLGNEGVITPEELRRELSRQGGKSRLGVPQSNAHRAKLSLAHTGVKRKPFTEETKRKLSLSHLGKSHPHTEESKRKISESLKLTWSNCDCK